VIVVNATVLSNLARVDRISILQELFGQITVPMQVYEEILRGIEAGYTFLKPADEIAEEENWISLEPLKGKKERRLFKELLERVGYGEAAGIAMAKERDLLFSSDDKVARRVAKENGVEISGTLGILQIAIEEGKLLVEEADEVLQEMNKGGYRSPIQSMKELGEAEQGI
jgi:predicted nucleic acid-binding protein